MKILKNRKAFAPVAIFLFIIMSVIVVSAASSVYNKYFKEDNNIREYDGVKINLSNSLPVQKSCSAEEAPGFGTTDCQPGLATSNSARQFADACIDIEEAGGEAWFRSSDLVNAPCSSCKDYFDAGGKLSSINVVRFPTKTCCELNRGRLNMNCDLCGGNEVKISSKDDCEKIKQEFDCYDLVQYEKFCVETPATTAGGACPDKEYFGGLISFPDFWCKTKEKFKSIFMPIKIATSIFLGVLSIIGSFIVLRSFDKSKKLRNIYLYSSLVLGVVIGVWSYYSFYLALIIVVVFYLTKGMLSFIPLFRGMTK